MSYRFHEIAHLPLPNGGEVRIGISGLGLLGSRIEIQFVERTITSYLLEKETANKIAKALMIATKKEGEAFSDPWVWLMNHPLPMPKGLK